VSYTKLVDTDKVRYQLSPVYFKELHASLLESFDQPDLYLLMRTYLGVSLEDVAGGHDKSELIYQLIFWAERTGRVDDLIAASLASNPDNPRLRAFVAEYTASKDLKADVFS